MAEQRRGASLRDLMGVRPMLQGQFAAPNMNLHNLPSVRNPEAGPGMYSTIWSMGIGDEEGNEILIPRIKYGRVLSTAEARAEYHRTGEHLGKFTSVEAANKFARWLHEQQEMSTSRRIFTEGLR